MFGSLNHYVRVKYIGYVEKKIKRKCKNKLEIWILFIRLKSRY